MGNGETLGLMLPAVPLCLLAGQGHGLRVTVLRAACSLATQWLTSGYLAANCTDNAKKDSAKNDLGPTQT
jgi:hypothetical protein